MLTSTLLHRDASKNADFLLDRCQIEEGVESRAKSPVAVPAALPDAYKYGGSCNGGIEVERAKGTT